MTPSALREIGIVSGLVIGGAILFALLRPAVLGSAVATVLLVVLSFGWLACLELFLPLLRRKAVAVLLSLLVVSGAVIGLGRLSAILGAVIAVGILLIVRTRIKREINDRLKLKVIPTFIVGTRYGVLALLVALGGLTVPVAADQLDIAQVQVTGPQIAPFLKPAEPFVSRLLPAYSPGDTVNEYIDQQIREAATQLPPGAAIDPRQREVTRQQLAQSFNISLSGNETLYEVLAKIINQRISSLLGTSPIVVSALLILVVVLAIRAFMPLLVWPTLGAIALALFLAEKTGVISRQSATVSIERIVLE